MPRVSQAELHIWFAAIAPNTPIVEAVLGTFAENKGNQVYWVKGIGFVEADPIKLPGLTHLMGFQRTVGSPRVGTAGGVLTPTTSVSNVDCATPSFYRNLSSIPLRKRQKRQDAIAPYLSLTTNIELTPSTTYSTGGGVTEVYFQPTRSIS